MAHHTLTFVSHTHWDREWYQPFQEYRVRLVQLVDKLLDILDTDPDYRYFMLDGQTIALPDYLEIRPQNEERIRHHVVSGRLLIGPWHILPDEFLVSAESTVRNLLVGAAVAAGFGGRMDVGNIPDPFGHISQLPQILRGFDIDSAVFWRGVGEAPNEFIWEAPDGSQVLVIHQRRGYGNAARMPSSESAFVARTRQIVEGLTPTATTPHLLAMNGSDHIEPQRELPRLLAAADAALPDIEIRHGTLPQFIAAVRAARPALEVRRGEMRLSSHAPLLPGVLSTRIWIKQRNDACETLLTAWAEPAAAIAELVGAPLDLSGQSALVRQAWRYLLQNHPHDSICGCSIDQVHREMDVRFDWVEQIGEEVTRRSLTALAAAVDTRGEGDAPAIVVFNPTTRARGGWVDLDVPFPEGASGIRLVSGEQVLCPQLDHVRQDVIWQFELPVDHFQAMIGHEGIPDEIDGQGVRGFAASVEGDRLRIGVRVGPGVSPDRERIAQGQAQIARLIGQEGVATVQIHIHRGMVAHCTFVAQDVPGCGYRTYAVLAAEAAPEDIGREEIIENALLRVEVGPDGTFTLIDKSNGMRYPGLSRFVDVGDRGDEYNFDPVESDVVVSSGTDTRVELIERTPMRQVLEVSTIYRVPSGLDETRQARSAESVDLPIVSRLSLEAGAPYLQVATTIENRASDHRLRAHFPLPMRVDQFETEGHWDVISRPVDLPSDTADWVEQPVATQPQRTWTDVSDGSIGLMVANRGLPEVEVMRTAQGSELALTLLRCVGWLSRGDLSVRPGHAGPGLPAPEGQCTGSYTFHYALIPHQGDWRQAFHEAHAFHTPLRALVRPAQEGVLPPVGSLVCIEPEAFLVSAIKEPESGEGLLIRFWNTDDRPRTARVAFWRTPSRVARCNLGEREIEPLTIEADGAVHVPARGREAVSLRVTFD